jgi:hypothetical protein
MQRMPAAGSQRLASEISAVLLRRAHPAGARTEAVRLAAREVATDVALRAARLVVGRLILGAAVPGVEEASVELPGVDARALLAEPGSRRLAEARITAAAAGVARVEALGPDVRASDAVARRRERGAGVRRVLKWGGVETARLAACPFAALAVTEVATVRRRAFDRRAAPRQWRAGCPSAARPRAAADPAAATPAAAATAGASRASVAVADAAGLATAGCRQGEHAQDQEKKRAHGRAAKRSTYGGIAPLVSGSPEEGGSRNGYPGRLLASWRQDLPDDEEPEEGRRQQAEDGEDDRDRGSARGSNVHCPDCLPKGERCRNGRAQDQRGHPQDDGPVLVAPCRLLQVGQR